MTKPRILISYFFGDDMIPLGYSCADALRAIGHEVYCFNSQVENPLAQLLLKPANRILRGLGFKGREIGTNLPISRENFKRTLLKRAVSEFRPDWILVIRSHRFVDANLVAELKQDCGVQRVIGWRVDGPLDSPGLIPDAAIYDEYFCSHRYGYDPSSTGIKFLPVYGMDFSRYRNLYVAKPREYKHDIVLVAGHNPRRMEYLQKLLDLPLEIHGKWGKASRANPQLQKRIASKGIWGEELVSLYNTSKIVLNITGWDPAAYGGLNMRVFDVPATGAFLMTDYSPELEEFFEIGSEIECFRESGELADKLSYYLSHEVEREMIARRGYEKALSLPTIADRMKTIVDRARDQK